jgi:hypothetical protein
MPGGVFGISRGRIRREVRVDTYRSRVAIWSTASVSVYEQFTHALSRSARLQTFVNLIDASPSPGHPAPADFVR